MEWTIIIGIMLVIAALLAALRRDDPVRALEEQILALQNFESAHRFDQADKAASLLLDPQRQRFAIAKIDAPIVLYSFDRLISVAAERDGVTLKTFGRGTPFGNGTTFGYIRPSGLFLSGTYGLEESNEPIRRLALKIYIDDALSPVHEITFFDQKRGLPIDSHEVMLATIELDEWHCRFQAIPDGRPPAYTGEGRRRRRRGECSPLR